VLSLWALVCQLEWLWSSSGQVGADFCWIKISCSLEKEVCPHSFSDTLNTAV